MKHDVDNRMNYHLEKVSGLDENASERRSQVVRNSRAEHYPIGDTVVVAAYHHFCWLILIVVHSSLHFPSSYCQKEHLL